MERTLHEQLTELLMDNGASVSKKSIDKLVEFIGLRDQSIIDEFIKRGEKMLVHLQYQTKIEADTTVTDLAKPDASPNTNVANPQKEKP